MLCYCYVKLGHISYFNKIKFACHSVSAILGLTALTAVKRIYHFRNTWNSTMSKMHLEFLHRPVWLNKWIDWTDNITDQCATEKRKIANLQTGKGLTWRSQDKQRSSFTFMQSFSRTYNHSFHRDYSCSISIRPWVKNLCRLFTSRT